MKKRNNLLSLFIALGSMIVLGSCNGDKHEKDNEKKDIESDQTDRFAPGKDSLPDTPQFVFELNKKEFSVTPEDLTVTYISSDSIINIYAKTGDTSGLFLSIPCKMERPFSVSTGYSSEKTKIAFSEELAVVPTVVLNNYPEVDISFNNLDDGYHKQEIRPAAMTITVFREIAREGQAKNYLLKGFLHTLLFKNVYAAKAKEENQDYQLNGKFVIALSSYW